MNFAVKNTHDKQWEVYISLLNKLLGTSFEGKTDAYYGLNGRKTGYISASNRENVNTYGVSDGILFLKEALGIPKETKNSVTMSQSKSSPKQPTTYVRDYRLLNPYLM